MIGPAAAAYLLTDRLALMMGLSVGLGVVSAVSGYWLAHLLDASIAGAMATMVGVVFGLAFLFAPHRGLVAVLRRRARQRWTFAEKMLAIHLLNHEGLPEAERECHEAHLQEHLRWEAPFAARVVKLARQDGLVLRDKGHLSLTEAGRFLAREALVHA
jgi:manganese/zinc/iron transport system permease protein